MPSSLSVDLRPETFASVIGYNSVISAIRKKLSSGVPVAWLFDGPPGTGKTTLAQIVAREIQGDDLLDDPSEYEIRQVNAADFRGIEDVREMIRSSETYPIRGRYRVFIIDEAHQLTDAAQNCLLVPTEQKDTTTVWIFCTTRSDKMIEALRRRCFTFTLKGLSDAEVKQLVERAVGKGSQALVDALLAADIKSPGIILQAADKLWNGIPAEECVKGLGTPHEPLYKDVCKAVLSGNWTKVSSMLEQIRTADSRGLRQVLASMLSYALLKEDVGPKADAISGCLLGLATYNAFEDGIAYAATRAALYRCCKQIQGAK